MTDQSQIAIKDILHRHLPENFIVANVSHDDIAHPVSAADGPVVVLHPAAGSQLTISVHGDDGDDIIALANRVVNTLSTFMHPRLHLRRTTPIFDASDFRTGTRLFYTVPDASELSDDDLSAALHAAQ